MKTVIGGVVSLGNQPSVDVDHIDFPDVQPNKSVPSGAKGTLYLRQVPSNGPYKKNDVLAYRDSNNNNNCDLKVTENVGPTKYNITKQ